MLDGHEDNFSGNQVVLTGTDVGRPNCEAPGKTVMGNNSYYTSTGKVTECKMTLQEWMAKGNEVGSSVGKTPADATIIGWAKAKLGIAE
jgi:hypothetical protein